MNKKLVTNILTIAAVAVVAAGATYAWSGIKQSSTNVFATSHVSISISEDNGQWSGGWQLADMKPCQTKDINFTVTNTSNEPLNMYKKIEVVTDADANGAVNEAECLAEGGQWSGSGCTGNTAKFDLQSVIDYDLSVYVPCPTGNTTCGDPAGSGWWQTIYRDADNIKLSSLVNQDMSLGVIPANGTMQVKQSYRLDCNAGNEYQDDRMSFQIQIEGAQRIDQQTLTLENKVKVGTEWQVIDDAYKATLTYNTEGATFDYNVTGKVSQSNTSYSLIYYADPWDGNGLTGSAGKLIATVDSAGDGAIALSGSMDTGTMPNADDANAPIGAKLWLVLSTDYDAVNHVMTGWNPDNYLFETGLVNYMKN